MSFAFVDDHVLERGLRRALARRDEARAQIGEVGAEHARRRDMAAGRHPAGRAGSSSERTARISGISANGLSRPAWPPAPAHTAISPSTPGFGRFARVRMLMTSWKTSPP